MSLVPKMLNVVRKLVWMCVIVISGLIAFVEADETASNSTQSISDAQSSHIGENRAVIFASVAFLMIPTACGIGGITLLVYRYKQYMQKKEQKKRMVICYEDEEAEVQVIPFQTQMSYDIGNNLVHSSQQVAVTTAPSAVTPDNKLPLQVDSTELSISTADTVNLYFLTFQAWLQSPPKFSLTSTVDNNANNKSDLDQGTDLEKGDHTKQKSMLTKSASDSDGSRVSWMPKLRMPRLKRHEQLATQQQSSDLTENTSNVSDLTLTPPFGQEELETVDWLDEDDEEDKMEKKENGFRRWLNSRSSRKRSASFTLRI